MSSEQVKLLRRPLPPKKIQPLLKPLRSPAFSVEPITSRVHSGTEGNEWSCYGDTSLWNYDSWALGLAPTTLTFHSQAMSTAPPQVNSFPSQPHRTYTKCPLLDLLRDDPRYAKPPPSFCLNDFLKSAQSHDELVAPSQSVKILSRVNYKKLLQLFLFQLHSGHQKEVANQILSCEELPEVKPRIPLRQIACELAVQVQTQEMCVWHPGDECLSHSEHKSVEMWTPAKKKATYTQHPVNDVILSSAPAKFFQGSRRTCSPFHPAEECSSLAPTQLAVLECLKQHATALNLKAHFIAKLPDLSVLTQSLLYINLSFNDFTVFPVEVCELTHLEVLKLRDNPIKEIPAQIKKLICLKTLVFSFCKLTALPYQLYCLPSLQYLDVSHNLISTLTSDIKNLRSLKYLNVEGNQLVALPVSLLQVPLSQLKLSGNYTHPLLWASVSMNLPLSLTDTATQVLARTFPEQHYSSLPSVARLALSRAGVCDCCGGPLYGPGLKFVCPVRGLFGQIRVPILLLSCSPSCISSFRKQPHCLTNLLYRHNLTASPTSCTGTRQCLT